MYRRGSRLATFVTVTAVAVFAHAGTARAAERVAPEPIEGLVLARESLSSVGTPAEIPIEVDRSVRRWIIETGRAKIRDFPLPGRVAVDLELSSFNLLASGARFVVVDESGSRDLPPPIVHTFRGKVEGDADSLVSLTFFEDRIAGFIRTWDAEYSVGPENFNAAATDRTTLWVRERVDPPDGVPLFECGGAIEVESVLPSALAGPSSANAPTGPLAEAAITNEESTASIATIDGDTLLEATIAIDATVEFYQHFGSLTATQDYIVNLMAQVSTIYENEVKVLLDVGYLRVFTAEPDPYTDSSQSTSQLLSDLRDEWTTNQTSIERTAAHLFSVRDSGGAGIAYVDVLCNTNVGYGVSTTTANGSSWEKNLVAHELGHNFSSPHTHCYVPEIDQCAIQTGCYQGATVSSVGTIMSYCSQKQSVFHQRVKDEKIRPGAEAAYPACIDTAGLPGAIQGGSGAGLVLSKPAVCPSAFLQDDDGGSNSNLGYGGTERIAWIKRFTPPCYPFRLTTAEVLIAHASSVAPGRPIRILVYSDPAGTGDPLYATLVWSEDVTVDVVSSAVFNQYTLSDPVVITSGDYYVGFYDLEADATDTFIAAFDSSREGDSYRTANSTSPDAFSPHQGGTWMIRASGGAVEPGSVSLQWDTPCNEAGTPGQDYAIYSGLIGSFLDPAPLACTTSRATSYLASGAAADSFYLVVPSTSVAEGSYGLDGAGAERPPSAQACKPREIGACQ